MKTPTAAELAAAREPYALCVDGNNLAPDIFHGDLVRVDPATSASPGQMVVAEINNRLGLFKINAHGDLFDRCGAYHHKNGYRVLGIATGPLKVEAVIRPS